MPMTRKRSRRGGRQTRKAGKKTYAKKKPTLYNSSSLAPIPPRFVTKMKYAETFTLVGTGMRSQAMNLNSLFDPNRTGTGHQPYGFDQLCGPAGTALYNRYRVYRVDYVLSVANDTYNIQYAVLNTNDTPTIINNVSEARENPRCKYSVQNPNGTLKVMKGSLNIASLMGRTKAQYTAADSYQSVYNSSPSELALLNILVQGLNDDAGVSMTHSVNLLLTYHVELFDPHVLDQS